MPVSRFSLLSLAVLSSLSLSGAAHAADDDTIVTDRPGVAESSKVVGKGRVQLETSVAWERQRDDALHSRTLTTPSLLRVGLGDTLELRIETDGRTIEHDVDPASGTHAVSAGWADTELGLKWHVANQQGSHPSLGWLLHAALPSGSHDFKGHGVRPSLRLSAEWELPGDYSLGLMPGVGSDSDDNGSRYGYGVFAANLGKDFGEHAHGFVELAAPQIAHAAHGGTQMLFDTGMSYSVNRNCQVDFAVTHGLNHRTPDLGFAFGLSLRM
jgi:hypothetical protein